MAARIVANLPRSPFWSLRRRTNTVDLQLLWQSFEQRVGHGQRSLAQRHHKHLLELVDRDTLRLRSDSWMKHQRAALEMHVAIEGLRDVASLQRRGEDTQCRVLQG